ncbi:hypothetical protein EAF04_008207 [Stromatinia cepivora]|nr:hypothetical protein EAF04_008207 [Stromatinia cepivora]
MLQKRTASQMIGKSEKTGDNPLKRVKVMLKENEKKVAFSKNETEEFEDLIFQNKEDIAFHEEQIKEWEESIRRYKQYIQALQKTNREYQEDIEKNRLEILELKQEEEAIKLIKRQGEVREKRLQEAVNRILTKFLGSALENAGMSLEKEIKGDEKTTIWGVGMKKTEGDEEKKIKRENLIQMLQYI